MAILRKIVVQDFRNITLAEMSFSPNINCISGNNGEGKTNLMDAIWYLSMTKSALSSSDRYSFRYGTDAFAISGTYDMPLGTRSTFSIKVSSDGTKKLRRDDKPYKRISEHIGEIPIVMVSPSDGAMVNDSGEERRRFVNNVLSQLDSAYLSSMQQYNRLLQERNSLLKERDPDPGLLDVLDVRMDSFARTITQRRLSFISELSPVVSQYYTLLSGGKEKVEVALATDLGAERTLLDILSRSREKDKVLGYTSSGVHRDDLLFMMDGHNIRRGGSQGQQKTFLVSLKMAQYEIMKKQYGYAPILLLDDVFDKLDLTRTSNLLKMVAGHDFGQIFLTDSNKVRLQGIVDNITSDRAYFEAVGGNYTKL